MRLPCVQVVDQFYIVTLLPDRSIASATPAIGD
jgi:hypothetical protein